MLAEAERDVHRVGRPSHVEAGRVGTEDTLVAIRGCIEHADVVALVDPRGVHLDILGGCPAERLHGGDPTEALLYGVRREAGVRSQSVTLVGMVVQGDHRTREQGARRLVARDEQGQEEHEQLLPRERLAADLAPGEQRHQVVAAPSPLRTDVLDQERGELAQRRRRLVGWQVGRLDGGIGPAPEVGAVRGVDPQQLRDHVQGKRGAERRDEVDLLRRGHVVEQGHGARAHELRQTGQGTWREPAVDQTPELSVLRRVHVQDRSRRDRRCDVAGGVVDERASGRAEAGRISTDVSNVLVTGQHPEPLFAEVDGIVRPQARHHVVEVGSGEERRVTGVDALVPAHGLSVLCSSVPKFAPTCPLGPTRGPELI